MKKSLFVAYLFVCTVSFGKDFRIQRPKYIFDLDVVFLRKNIIPVVVIGSGPAGLTAAMYSTRAGMYTVVLTGDKPGGQLIDTTYVENWPGIDKKLGSDIMDTLEAQAHRFGAVLLDDIAVELNFDEWPFKITTGSGSVLHALAVIVATGASPRKLGIPGEFKYWGHGVTSCALCDAHFFKGKDVVVIGGGDAAVGEAILLSPYVKSVKILVRKNRMRSAKRVRDQLTEYDNISVVHNVEAIEVLGDGKRVTGLKVLNNETGEMSTMPIDGVFLAIGQNPNTELFQDVLQVNKLGYIMLADKSQQTSREGVYAAGDVEDAEYRQAVVAAAHGCKAALESVSWLRENGLTELVLKKIKSSFYRHPVTD